MLERILVAVIVLACLVYSVRKIVRILRGREGDGCAFCSGDTTHGKTGKGCMGCAGCNHWDTCTSTDKETKPDSADAGGQRH
jgi:hypothetical protein